MKTTPFSHRIMKSLWEKGQFPMLSPSLPAFNKHTDRGAGLTTRNIFQVPVLRTEYTKDGWKHLTFNYHWHTTQSSRQRSKSTYDWFPWPTALCLLFSPKHKQVLIYCTTWALCCAHPQGPVSHNDSFRLEQEAKTDEQTHMPLKASAHFPLPFGEPQPKSNRKLVE